MVFVSNLGRIRKIFADAEFASHKYGGTTKEKFSVLNSIYFISCGLLYGVEGDAHGQCGWGQGRISSVLCKGV